MSKLNYKTFSNYQGMYLFFIVNALTSLSFAFILPIMSFFLIEQLQISPAYIGIYTVCTALSGIIYSRQLGRLSDKGISNKKLLMLTIFGITFSALSFAFITNFFHAVLVGVVFMGLGSASIPQMFAIIRRYADSTGKNSTIINSQMRSVVSLVWILGPPLAFTVVDLFGFTFTFSFAAIIGCAVFIIVSLYMPNIKSVQEKNTRNVKIKPKEKLNITILTLGIIMLLANLANNIYVAGMPLFITKELTLPVSLSGILLGITASIEVPVMLLSAKLAQKISKVNLLIFSFLCAIIFYSGFQFAENIYSLICLQIFNGIFFGVFVGLGVTIIQDQLPESIGAASAFYSNMMMIGSMCGGALMGFLAQIHSYKFALLGSLVAISIAFLILTVLAFLQRCSRLSAQIG